MRYFEKEAEEEKGLGSGLLPWVTGAAGIAAGVSAVHFKPNIVDGFHKLTGALKSGTEGVKVVEKGSKEVTKNIVPKDNLAPRLLPQHTEPEIKLNAETIPSSRPTAKKRGLHYPQSLGLQ